MNWLWHRGRNPLTHLTISTMAALMICTSVVRAEDAPKPDQLKQLYEDALGQLKNAQERKNQLAAENEQLKARVADLQKQLEASQQQAAALQHEADSYAEKTYDLRSRYTAWLEFLRRYPQLKTRWKAFLENDQLSAPLDLPAMIDPEWPLSAQG